MYFCSVCSLQRDQEAKTQASKENCVKFKYLYSEKNIYNRVELKCKVIFSQFHITFAIGNLLIG